MTFPFRSMQPVKIWQLDLNKARKGELPQSFKEARNAVFQDNNAKPKQ